MASKDSKSPFKRLEAAVSNESLGEAVVHRRQYVTTTLTGLLQATLSQAMEASATIGYAHLPERMKLRHEWNSGHDKSSLIVIQSENPGTWTPVEIEISPRADLGREAWIIWNSPQGGAYIVAKPVKNNPGNMFAVREMWDVLVVLGPDAVFKGFETLVPLIINHPNGREPDLIIPEPAGASTSECPQRRMVEGAINFADHMEPWLKKKLIEGQWLKFQQRLHEAVSGELNSEKLFPAIGAVLRSMMKPDLLEIMIFTRTGIRYEEFLSWRKNYTGIGDDSTALLLSEEFISELIRNRTPRLLDPTTQTGIMNRHLAQLTGLQEGLVIPLRNLQSVEGLLALYYIRPTEMSVRDTEKIALIGDVVGRSIETSNAHARVHRMATIDALTNLYNRRYFTDHLRREMKRARRYNHPVALIMVDIDHFKVYNDTHGHLMGDKLLKIFAEVMKKSVRSEDIVARYGGEEFVVVLPVTDAENGYIVAEKLRREVYECNFPHGESQPLGRVTISLGVSDITPKDPSAQEFRDLINHADQALYRAKDEGRNRTKVYSPELDSTS